MSYQVCVSIITSSTMAQILKFHDERPFASGQRRRGRGRRVPRRLSIAELRSAMSPEMRSTLQRRLRWFNSMDGYVDNDIVQDVSSEEELMPACLRQRVMPPELIEMNLQHNLQWIEDHLRFRMRSDLSDEITGKDKFHIITMPRPVWDAFKKHLTDQTVANVSTRSIKAYCRGRSYSCVREQFGYEDTQIIPALVNQCWHFVKWIDESNGRFYRAKVTKLNFTYDEFSNRIRVDFVYCVQKVGIPADAWQWVSS